MLKKFSFSCQKGQSLVEYALILALISVACVGSLGNIGDAANTTLSKISLTMNGASGGGGSPPIVGGPGQQMMGNSPVI